MANREHNVALARHDNYSIVAIQPFPEELCVGDLPVPSRVGLDGEVLADAPIAIGTEHHDAEVVVKFINEIFSCDREFRDYGEAVARAVGGYALYPKIYNVSNREEHSSIFQHPMVFADRNFTRPLSSTIRTCRLEIFPRR